MFGVLVTAKFGTTDFHLSVHGTSSTMFPITSTPDVSVTTSDLLVGDGGTQLQKKLVTKTIMIGVILTVKAMECIMVTLPVTLVLPLKPKLKLMLILDMFTTDVGSLIDLEDHHNKTIFYFLLYLKKVFSFML